MPGRRLGSILGSLRYAIFLLPLFSIVCAVPRDTSVTTHLEVGRFGDVGTGYTVQCSDWFPDWISNNPPDVSVTSFQLAQAYPSGSRVVREIDGEEVVEFVAPDPVTDTVEAPWLAYDLDDQAGREGYMAALLSYVLEGMIDADFVAQNNEARDWYHVPFMTTDTFSRREPYHGLTKERPLESDDGHSWIVPGQELQSYAIGYYNRMGAYTIGQIFKSMDPSATNTGAAQFIDGTVVFKTIFAEYDPSKIVADLYPLNGAPEWTVLDVETEALVTARLIQLDIAVKDSVRGQDGCS